MKKKRQSEPELLQYRVRYSLDGDVTPVEKYFMATTGEQAFEMFSYSCREFQAIPELLDFAEWNRWTEEWKEIPHPITVPETSDA